MKSKICLVEEQRAYVVGSRVQRIWQDKDHSYICLLYTSDAADE